MGCLNAEIYTLEPDPDNAGVGIIMKTIFLLLLIFISNFSLSAKETLTVYTYDSFVSEWGPGPIIKKIFEKKYNQNIEFVAADSGAALLTKIILEGSSTKADIILGLDMNLFEEAKNKYYENHVYFKKYQDEVFNVVRDPQLIEQAILDELDGRVPKRQLPNAMIEDYLGYFDGNSTQRVVKQMYSDISTLQKNKTA